MNRGADGHLEALFFGDHTSGGTYTPTMTDVRLSGFDRVEDAVVMLHETHHASLNDSTAWGTALHVTARLGLRHRDSFRHLLDAARHAHESYATFASTQLALVEHHNANDVLAAYPMYRQLYQQTLRFVRQVPGPHRRYLVATAAARVSMQTPILEALIAVDLEPLRLADIREIDTPDGRWRWLNRRLQGVLDEICLAADRSVADQFGHDALPPDSFQSGQTSSHEQFDPMWACWELAIYDEFATQLRSAGATPLAYDGHVLASNTAVDAARARDPNVELRTVDPAAPRASDRATAAAAIGQIRLHLAPARWRAAVAASDVDEIEVGSTRIGGHPVLIVDARLGTRLGEQFAWDADYGWATARRGPIIAHRAIESDPAGSLIVHTVLDVPSELERLIARCNDTARSAAIVAVSCLIDRDWSARWMSTLGSADALVFLIDVELDRFVRNFTGGEVTIEVGLVDLDDASGVRRRAAIIEASNSSALWIFIADDIATGLLLAQLRLTDGVNVVTDAPIGERHRDTITIAATHLLATESFVDLNGLEGHL